MEPTPSSTRTNQTEKRKHHPYTSSSDSSPMEPDVVEIPAPIARTSRPRKLREIGLREVIDIDNDEHDPNLVIIEEKTETVDKGKAVIDVEDGNSSCQEGVESVHHSFNKAGGSFGSISGSTSPIGQASHPSGFLDGQIYDLSCYDEDHMDWSLDLPVDVDCDYDMLQAHFDNMDIPPEVEAPFPWPSLADHGKMLSAGSYTPSSGSQLHPNALDLPNGTNGTASFVFPELAHKDTKPASSNGPGLQGPVNFKNHPLDVDPPPVTFTPTSQNKKNRASSRHRRSSKHFSFGFESFKAQKLLDPFRNKKMGTASSSSTNPSNPKQVGANNHPFGAPSATSSHNPEKSASTQLGYTEVYTSGFPHHTSIPPPAYDPYKSWWKEAAKNTMQGFPHAKFSGYFPFKASANNTPEAENVDWLHDPSDSQTNANEDEVMRKLQLFKQFDTVEDYSDHYYVKHGSAKNQPARSWAKRIQEEWKSLENNLPDTIFVRVYETRMDLLRAVIIGAEGTPYHDGLFFFDVFFPPGYPNVPPNVHYHSGGLRLNPNLYACGKVCLSLLNTWSGGKNEKWIPGVSTMLQVLVSIQGLILNSKPYFNEPGYASLAGSKNGDMMSEKYNEDTFLLSLRTMSYTIRRPPQHFKDFVMGHFFKHAHDILVACKAYLDGAQVGCLAKGGVQDVDEGDKSCSSMLKQSLPGYVNMLVADFTKIGVKDCEKFLPQARKDNQQKDALKIKPHD